MDYLTGFLIFVVVAATVVGVLWYKGVFGNALKINPSGGSSVGANVMTSGCPNGWCYDKETGYPHCCRN